MKHIIKMKGWPKHDIELEFLTAEQRVGTYRDGIVVFIDGVKHACLVFNVEDRDADKPTLVVHTAPVFGTWTDKKQINLVPEEKKDYVEPRDR